MKKVYVRLVSCLVLIFLLLTPLTLSYAKGINKGETEVGIELEVVTPKKEIDKKPPLIDGGSNKKNYQFLPQTGELLSSLIVILLGISLFIFSLGVMSIKQLYQTTGLEY